VRVAGSEVVIQERQIGVRERGVVDEDLVNVYIGIAIAVTANADRGARRVRRARGVGVHLRPVGVESREAGAVDLERGVEPAGAERGSGIDPSCALVEGDGIVARVVELRAPDADPVAGRCVADLDERPLLGVRGDADHGDDGDVRSPEPEVGGRLDVLRQPVAEEAGLAIQYIRLVGQSGTADRLRDVVAVARLVLPAANRIVVTHNRRALIRCLINCSI